MAVAVFPGSFDPITNGHIKILENGMKIFDKIIIAVANNIEKKELIPVDVRKQLIEESVKNIQNVKVVYFDGLTVDFAEKNGADFILRGLRNSKDFEYEQEIAGVNSSLNSNIKTVFLLAERGFQYISSSAIKEIYKSGGDISKFVPIPVAEYFKTLESGKN